MFSAWSWWYWIVREVINVNLALGVDVALVCMDVAVVDVDMALVVVGVAFLLASVVLIVVGVSSFAFGSL